MLMRLLILAAALTVTSSASAQSTYYVSPTGSNIGSGTVNSPLATIQAAMVRAVPGDTVYVRGGSYRSTTAIRLDKSGTEGSRIHIWAYPSEVPVFDFTGAPRGFEIRANYLHLKGLVSERSNDKGFLVTQASHNILEQVVARFHMNSGVQVENQSAYNLILNVDSYANYDPQNNGENADGFAVKFGVGPGNVLRGCCAWGNSDDGYDFWSQDHPNHQGVRVEDSWAFDNGYNVWDDPNFQGDSNGFKLGHGPGAHVLVRNVAWGHRVHGFDVNGNLSGVTLYNNTGFLNGGSNFFFDDDRNVNQGVSVLRNNLSFGNIRMDMRVTDHDRNTWNFGVPNARRVDFVSDQPTGADGPRGPDGSLPVIDFLRLVPDSPLIDAGVDVGLPFRGVAPDIGAFEFEGGATQAEPTASGDSNLILMGANPVRQSVRLAVDLSAPETVKLEVFDALGRLVASLMDGSFPIGRHTAEWDARALAPGLYIARLQTGTSLQNLSLTVAR